MQQCFTEEEYIGKNYPNYFKTPHWVQLKEDLIYSNRNVHCWIDEITYSLLPHHERYDNLFHERLHRDIFILCYNCHRQLHFYRTFFFFTVKTKLTPSSLKRRRLFLRMLFCMRKRRVGLSIWYFLRCTINL